jgi:hypothetical protein
MLPSRLLGKLTYSGSRIRMVWHTRNFKTFYRGDEAKALPREFVTLHLVEKNGRFGIVNREGHCIAEPFSATDEVSGFTEFTDLSAATSDFEQHCANLKRTGWLEYRPA